MVVQTLLFINLAPAVALWLRDRKLFFGFLAVGAALAFMVGFQLWAAECEFIHLLWSGGPNKQAFWFWTVYALAVPLVAGRLGPRGKVVMIALLLFGLGLACYLYLPLASSRNPLMNPEQLTPISDNSTLALS